MSFSKKIVTTYSKSLFQSISNFQKLQKASEPTLQDIKEFDIAKIVSFTETEPRIDPNLSVEAIGEELTLIRALLTSSKKFRTLFNNPTVPEQQKLDILVSVFPGLSLMTRSFLKVLKEKSHLGLLPEVADEYDEILLKFKNCTKVKLITASILEESYGLFLLKTLKSLTKSKEIILEISYNPQLLGGLILEYNSTSTDASILKEFSLFFNEG